MELHRIINLDCSKKENRIKLLKATNKILKVEEKQNKEKLEKICKSLMKKYNKPFRCFYLNNEKIQVSVCINNNAFSSFICNSYYELLCKYILFVKVYKNYEEKISNFKLNGGK